MSTFNTMLHHLIALLPDILFYTVLYYLKFTDHFKRTTARAKWRNVALESQNLMSFKCDNLEVIEIKHSKDDEIDELFELLMGLWQNLGKTTIKPTKV